MSHRIHNKPKTSTKLKHTNKEDLMVTAFHEAGHTLADWFCQELLWFDEVTIRPDNVYLGHLETDDNRNILINIFSSYTRVSKPPLMRCLIFDLAGPYAENMVTTKDPAWFRKGMAEERNRDVSDYYRAAELVKSIFHNPARENQILKKAARWTQELLNRPEMWKIVKDLATALIKKRGVLNKKQVLKIISTTWKDMTVGPYLEIGSKWRRRLHISDEALYATQINGRKEAKVTTTK